MKNSNEKILFEDGIEEIPAAAFQGCKIKEVTIPDTVTSIGCGAFKDCYHLETILFGNGRIKDIGDDAFRGCGVKEVTIPDTVTSIGYGAFMDCRGLQKVKLSENLQIIKPDVFRGCLSLSDITIPKGVRKVSYLAFRNCERLKNLTIEGNPIIEGLPLTARMYENWGLDNLQISAKSLVSVYKAGFFMAPVKKLTIIGEKKTVTLNGVFFKFEDPKYRRCVGEVFCGKNVFEEAKFLGTPLENEASNLVSLQVKQGTEKFLEEIMSLLDK